MKIETFIKDKKNKYKITFDNHTSVLIYDDVIVKYNLLSNKVLSLKQYDEIIKYNSSLDSYYLSLDYLNKKMRTELEIRKYLEKKEIPKNIIDITIKRLIDNHALNEELYIKSFVNDQINLSNIGPNKIIKKLSELGIKKDISLAYISTIDNTIWENKVSKLIDKKIKTNNNSSLSILKNKIVMSLYNDGYDKTMIQNILNNKNITIDSKIIEKEYMKQYNKLSKKFSGSALDYQIKIKMLSKGFKTEDLEQIKKEY